MFEKPLTTKNEESNSERTEAIIEKELNEYGLQMEKALEDLAVEKSTNGQPQDVGTVLRESLIISWTFDSVLNDTEGLLDVDDLQKMIDGKVTMLGLEPDKFSLHKYHDLAREHDALIKK